MEKNKTPTRIFWITKDEGMNRLLWYLILVVLLSAFCFLTLNVWLLPYSIAYNENGIITPGYLLYAAIGILFSTPTPFVSVLILSLFIERNGFKHKMRNIFLTEKKMLYPFSVLLTAVIWLVSSIVLWVWADRNHCTSKPCT